jgi:hypothetical protein
MLNELITCLLLCLGNENLQKIQEILQKILSKTQPADFHWLEILTARFLQK